MPARVGERERALITERARKLGLGVSEYLRRVALRDLGDHVVASRVANILFNLPKGWLAEYVLFERAEKMGWLFRTLGLRISYTSALEYHTPIQLGLWWVFLDADPSIVDWVIGELRGRGFRAGRWGEPAGEPLIDPSNPLFLVRPMPPGSAAEPMEPIEELVIDLLPESEWCSAELFVNYGERLRWERVWWVARMWGKEHYLRELIEMLEKGEMKGRHFHKWLAVAAADRASAKANYHQCWCVQESIVWETVKS
jgi:hypothetical protein